MPVTNPVQPDPQVAQTSPKRELKVQSADNTNSITTRSLEIDVKKVETDSSFPAYSGAGLAIDKPNLGFGDDGMNSLIMLDGHVYTAGKFRTGKGGILIKVNLEIKNMSETDQTFRLGDIQVNSNSSSVKEKADIFAVGLGTYAFVKDKSTIEKVKNKTVKIASYKSTNLVYIFPALIDSKSWKLTYKGKYEVELKGKERDVPVTKPVQPDQPVVRTSSNPGFGASMKPETPSAYQTKFAIAAIQPTNSTSGPFVRLKRPQHRSYFVLVLMLVIIWNLALMVPIIIGVGARHVVKGKLTMKGYTIISDPQYPLIFRLVRGEGYVYEQGRGIVITPSNKRVELDDSRNSLFNASRNGHIEEVKMLITNGADVNVKTASGKTALMAASGNGHIEVVKMLIDKGADVNAKARDGGTALMQGAYSAYIEVVKMLIANGADVNAKSGDGTTPLMDASVNGYIEVVKMLIDKGAVVNAKASNGWTG